MKQQLLSENTFTFFISRGAEFQSKLFLGGYPKFYTKDADPQFHKVIQKSWWTLKLDAVKVGDSETGLCRGQNCGIIVDTGCSGMAVADVDSDSFLSKVKEGVRCGNYSEWPDIT